MADETPVVPETTEEAIVETEVATPEVPAEETPAE